MILVGAHDVSDVKEPRRLIECRATRPKLADRRRQFASFTCHEVDVVRQREIMTNGEGDVTGDVLLMLGDVLVARLDHFDAGRGAFPWKPFLAPLRNNLIEARETNKIKRRAINN